MFRPIFLQCMSLIAVAGFGVASQAIRPAGDPAPTAQVNGHSVKLSWGPSTPASKSPRDAVVGYNVYRSTVSHDPKPTRITSKPWAGTTYTDSEVEAGKTYFYVTRGVTAGGAESAPSNEAKAVMPPQ